jgi:hypothetical protein
MNKKSQIVLIFIFIIIVMFFLFPKSCGEGQGRPQNFAKQTNTRVI